MVLIAVLGCGTMGLKIAGNFAYAGHTVQIFDSDTNQMATALQRIERDRNQLFSDGLIESSNFSGKILPLTRFEDVVKDVEFVFECIFEDLESKRNLAEKVGQCAPTDVIICSNTMQLDLEKISANLQQKQNFLGVRFLYPVYYIREVELNLTPSTSAQTINKLRKLLEPMDKVLFFRSTSEPLILNEDQREYRRKVRLEFLREKKSNSIDCEEKLPELTFSTSIDPNKSEKNDRQMNCSICLDRQRNALIRSCNHLVTCYPCALVLFHNHHPCPVCRQPIEEIIRIFT